MKDPKNPPRAAPNALNNALPIPSPASKEETPTISGPTIGILPNIPETIFTPFFPINFSPSLLALLAALCFITPPLILVIFLPTAVFKNFCPTFAVALSCNLSIGPFLPPNGFISIANIADPTMTAALIRLTSAPETCSTASRASSPKVSPIQPTVASYASIPHDMNVTRPFNILPTHSEINVRAPTAAVSTGLSFSM